MGRKQTQTHIDNDIVSLKDINIDNDNDMDYAEDLRKQVLNEVTEYRLNDIQKFLFGDYNKNFGDCVVFVGPAIKQLERFMYVWMNDLSEESRKSIINYQLGYDRDPRSRKYSEYTNSPIWKYISSIIKIVGDYTCVCCGERCHPAHLVVHHRSYNHIGSELNHLDEVDLLCTDCHMKIHDVRRHNEYK